MLVNRCKKCGGVMGFLLRTVQGQSIFFCSNNVTTMDMQGTRGTTLVACGNHQDDEGRVLPPRTHLAYQRGEKWKTYTV